MTGRPTRRRAITIIAVAAGATAVPLSATGANEGRLHVWRGAALGAVATLQLYHPDDLAAARLIERVAAETRRLERIFSLYKPDSDLSRLNRIGFIEAPPPEMVDLLRQAAFYRSIADGAFDVSVQPLWTLYRDHFSQANANPEGPPDAAVREALARVDASRISVSADRISLSEGMALTLNGIAQGYITDRIVDLLRREGVAHSLVDMGETRAMDARPDGGAWRVGVADPGDPQEICAELDLLDKAIATSGGYGFAFEPSGCFNHLFDPRTGRCSHLYRSVSVVADTATAADALSTAVSFVPKDLVRAMLRSSGAHCAFLVDQDRKICAIEA